jgi:hypothetical protein
MNWLRPIPCHKARERLHPFNTNQLRKQLEASKPDGDGVEEMVEFPCQVHSFSPPISVLTLVLSSSRSSSAIFSSASSTLTPVVCFFFDAAFGFFGLTSSPPSSIPFAVPFSVAFLRFLPAAEPGARALVGVGVGVVTGADAAAVLAAGAVPLVRASDSFFSL